MCHVHAQVTDLGGWVNAMNRETLNKKIWYRAVKVFFALFFLGAQIVSFAFATDRMSHKVPIIHCINGSPATGSGFADKISQDYDYVGVYIINAECDLGSATKKVIDRPRGVQNFWIEYVNKYSLTERVASHSILFLSVCILFWVISRIFFYIVLGERFVQKRN